MMHVLLRLTMTRWGGFMDQPGCDNLGSGCHSGSRDAANVGMDNAILGMAC